MSEPRRLLNDTTYLLTRRVLWRQFRLKPSDKVNQILLYCLAYAAQRYQIKIHAFCFLSNHYHLVLTDPGSRLPRFMAWLNKYTAKCINTLHGEWGTLWDPGSYSAVVLANEEAVLDKILYTLCNPVEAELVSRASQWPGLRTAADEVARASYEVERPEVFFRKNGPLPPTVRLTLAPLQCCEHLSTDELAALLSKGVQEREEEVQRRVKKKRRGFLGWRNVVKQRRVDAPKNPEPRRGIQPRLACRDKWKRIEILGTLKGFLEKYREALTRFLKGERDVVFPAGTYLMRVRFKVNCAAA